MLHVRWLGQVAYNDASALQHSLFEARPDDWLLLLEHPHVFTIGPGGDDANVLVDPSSLGVELVRTDRGGDVTYHGPGQLVGYPIATVGRGHAGAMTDTVAYVHSIEQVLIDALHDLGLSDVGRLGRHRGVWVAPGSDEPRKIAAVGVRLSRGRSMHGFALNVDPDLAWFDRIVPCGLRDKQVTSLAAEGIGSSMRDVVDAVVARACDVWVPDGAADDAGWDRADVAWSEHPCDIAYLSGGVTAEDGDGVTARRRERLADAGVGEGLDVTTRKPPWLKARLHSDAGYNQVRRIVRDRSLSTVCEEAGCPNISECWSSGTATFMINGERCTRGCAFCLVDTRKPMPLDLDEPCRVADAVEAMGLDFAVVTAVARDDLDDGGALGFVETILAIRGRVPGCSVEVLIPDCKGDRAALGSIFDVGPDVLNHNVETVPRLQRAVRPSASYARSLAVLSLAKQAGLTTKSGLIVGMGETDDEVIEVLADLNGIGVDIVTIGQYLRPTAAHLPVARWVEPETFVRWKDVGESMGIGHVESSPLTRASYHARGSVEGLTERSAPVG